MKRGSDDEPRGRRRRGPRIVVVSTAMLALVALECGGSDSTVLLTVTAEANLAPVAHVRVTMSNAAANNIKVFPRVGDAASSTPINFPATLAIVIPRSRSGLLDLAVDGLDAAMAVVANGAISVAINSGGRTNASVQLRAGPSLCGNGVVDPGEECDDGNRVSGDGCDFMCTLEKSRDGGIDGITAAGGGAAGGGGLGGAAGATSSGGTAGTAQDGGQVDTATQLKTAGTACASAGECASGACRGNCCSGACDGDEVCATCDVTGACVKNTGSNCGNSQCQRSLRWFQRMRDGARRRWSSLQQLF